MSRHGLPAVVVEGLRGGGDFVAARAMPCHVTVSTGGCRGSGDAVSRHGLPPGVVEGLVMPCHVTVSHRGL